MPRNSNWLTNRFQYLWQKYFADIGQGNEVYVRFGRRSKTRFGSIRCDKADNSVISVNGLFAELIIPLEVIDITLAHELIHYIHGFYSPHPRQFRYPHQGGIINRELKKRGLGPKLIFQKQWIKTNWPKICQKYFPNKRRSYGVLVLPNRYR